MKLINLDDLVLIGPGSEWFWTAVSAIVVAITFFAIYRQLRLQRGSSAIAQLESLGRDWVSERMTRAYLEVLLAVQAGTDPADFPPNAAIQVGDFWEKVGYLTRMGYFDRNLVHWNLGVQVERAWLRMRPVVLLAQKNEGPLVWSEFEWLARTMADLNAKHGITIAGDVDAMAAALPRTIRQARESIAAEEALRTVPVRLTDLPIAVTTQLSGISGGN